VESLSAYMTVTDKKRKYLTRAKTSSVYTWNKTENWQKH